MKIGIIGGTGDIGKGLALRLSDKYQIIIGSRDEKKAIETAEHIVQTLQKINIKSTCKGSTNEDAVKDSDIIVISVMFPYVSQTLSTINPKYFENKIIISPVNPIEKRNGYFYYNPPKEGSAALAIQKMLPKSVKLVTAFNNIAANKWTLINEDLEYTVAVCGDDLQTKKEVMSLVSKISKLHAVDAGPLDISGIIESITPLVLNIAKNNNLKDVWVYYK